MATTATFDYHWDGYLVLDETPSGQDLGTFDYHWDGEAGVCEEASVGPVASKPWILGNRSRIYGGGVS